MATEAAERGALDRISGRAEERRRPLDAMKATPEDREAAVAAALEVEEGGGALDAPKEAVPLRLCMASTRAFKWEKDAASVEGVTNVGEAPVAPTTPPLPLTL